MRSILIIKNNYNIDPELRKRLEKDYKTYIAIDVWEGLDIIDESYVDTFVIMSDNHIEKYTWSFLNELYKSHSSFTPLIFISENPSNDLHTHLYKNSSWYFIPFPIDHEDFIAMIQNALKIANLLDDKSILLEKSGHEYKYIVKNISRIQRNRNRYIKIFSRNPLTQIEEEEEFFYDEPLHQFPKDHGIEKQIKQAYQSWLVNATDVKEIITKDMELVLTNGIVIPASRKYIKNFKNKKDKKE